MEASRSTSFDPGADPDHRPEDEDEPGLFRFEDAPEESDEARRSRTARHFRITMTVLAVLAVGMLAIAGPKVWRMIQHGGATLTMPPAVGDLKRDDSDRAKVAAEDLVAAMRARIDLDEMAAAVYHEPAGGPGRSIMLFGGTALLWNPEAELDAVLTLAEDTGDKIRDLRPVDPGPLGGVMKCGSVGTAQAPMAVCGWADHGSIALALFPTRSASDAEALMRILRSATLTR